MLTKVLKGDVCMFNPLRHRNNNDQIGYPSSLSKNFQHDQIHTHLQSCWPVCCGLVACRGHNTGFFVSPSQRFLGSFGPIDLHQRRTFLCRSCRSQHTYGYSHTRSTSTNGMASAEVCIPKDWLVNDFFDWGFVSQHSNSLPMISVLFGGRTYQ